MSKLANDFNSLPPEFQDVLCLARDTYNSVSYLAGPAAAYAGGVGPLPFSFRLVFTNPFGGRNGFHSQQRLS